MRGKLWFLGGLAAGFVLGARAGREKYEEMVQTARKIKEHPTVQEATGVAQEQANRLITQGKDKLSQSRLAETRIGEKLLSPAGTSTRTSALDRDDVLDDSTLAMTGTTATSPTGGSTYSTGTGTTGPNSSASSTPSTGTTPGTSTGSTSGY
jgi:hypothetical protein